MKRRSSDGWNGVGAQRRRQLLTEAKRVLRFQISTNEQAGNDADGAVLAKTDHGITGLLVRAG